MVKSNDFDDLWRWAEDELESLWDQEKSIVASLPEKNRSILFTRLSLIYLRYIVVSQQLDVCYRNMLHVQKRRDICTIIQAVLGRIVELKNELSVLDYNETPFIGAALAQLKLSPDQIDPPLTLFTENGSAVSSPEVTDRKELVKRVLDKLERNANRRDLLGDGTIMTWDEAVALIQIHERARQGRLRFSLMKQIRQQKIQAGRGLHKLKPAMSPTAAALKIQSAWRSFLGLKRVRDLRHREMVFLGMVSDKKRVNLEIARANELAEQRKLNQIDLEAKFRVEHQRLLELTRMKEATSVRERILQVIRRWYIEYREAHGKFPELPPEEEGGSMAIHSAPVVATPTPGAGANKTKEGGGNAAANAAKTPGKRGEDDKPKGVDMTPSQWLEQIVRENQKYYDIWRDRAEVGGTGWDVELLKAQVCDELNEECRLEADVQARTELERLKSAYDRDRGRKSKKGRKTSRKGGKKAKRIRKEKDLTPDRSLESLVEELVQSGVIRSYPKCYMDSFIGSVSVVDPMTRKWKRDTFPSLGDIRCSLIENCIFTIGSEEIRQRTPLTRSVLLAGPKGVGKTLLIHAICNHLGATLFDISNSTLMGRYPGKAGMTMLVHLITKVTRLLQPAVIVIEDVDRLFVKKSVRSERWDMRRMRKELPKILRGIVPEDRVLLIGTTACPWECDQRSLTQCFQRMIAIPPPDYGTRFTMWSNFLCQITGPALLPAPCELTNLARLSDTYTAESILRAINEVLSDRRKQLLIRQPLKAEEFVSPLAKSEPVYREEEENLRTWSSKTPLRRKRNRNADADEDEFLANGEKANAKSKKKKKKKKKKGVTSKKGGVKKRL